MTVRQGAPTVLLVDDDVAFVFWLGEIFTGSGYQALPALSSRYALSLTRMLSHPVAVLVINPTLRGAQRLIAVLSARQPGLRVLLISDALEVGFQHPTIRRPIPGEAMSKTEWVSNVRKVLMRAAAGR